MVLVYVVAVVCGLLQGEVVSALADVPSFYSAGDCKHPSGASGDAEHQHPLNDEDMVIELLSLEDWAQVDVWAPDSVYNVTVTSPKKMEVLLGVNAGTLENVGEEGPGTADCSGMMWYTAEKESSHAVLWKSPACCEFTGTEVQFFVTGSMREDDFLRQQQALVPSELSTCSCSDTASSPASLAVLTPLPDEKAEATDDSGTTFTDGEEPSTDVGSGGEIDPNEGKVVEDVSATKEHKSSSFGYAFLIMLLTITIAWSSVWFYRKYRVQQMRNREFEGLEMRGYAQWSDAAGL